MRTLGVDYGRRRIGLALSDASGILATPWRAIEAGGDPAAAAVAVARLLAEFADTDDPVEEIVVGLPLRLNGEETGSTAATRAFSAVLGQRTGLVVHFQDERLSSREAESRLALRERDWRQRKEKLDAAAAAVILQDFLERRPTKVSSREEGEDE